MLDYNANVLLESSGLKSIRIATKSIRSPDVLRFIQTKSPRFKGLMAYSAAEAAFLAEQGFDDILIGYPTLEPHDIEAALRQGKRITFMACSKEHLDCLNTIAERLGVKADVCIDLDQSMPLPGLYFGVRRSSLREMGDVIQFVEYLTYQPHLQFKGFMGYDAQIAGVPDHRGIWSLRDFVVRQLKKRSAHILRLQRAQLSVAVKAAGFPFDLFNVGGTGSLSVFKDDADVTELTAGSGFYAPRLFDDYCHLKLSAALLFALPVTRKSSSRWITCHGGGFVASGASGLDRLPTPYLPEGLFLVRHEGAGEVQTPLVGKIDNIKIGDPIFFRHAKAGELCEHFNEIHLFKDGQVVGAAKTYRGLGKAFL